MDILKRRGLRLSIPVKVMLFTGIVYLVTWLFAIYLEGIIGVDFKTSVLGFKLKHIYWTFQVLLVSGAATLGTYFFLDRPLYRLTKAMSHAEEGDFLIRAPILSRDELGELARSFNHMLSRLTDLAAHKIEAEHDLIVAQEQLKYRKQIEEKSKIIERTNRTLENLVKDLSLIYEIGQEVSSIVDLDRLYENVTETLRTYLKIGELVILVFDEKKEKLHIKVAEGVPNKEEVVRKTFDLGEGIPGLVAKVGKRIYIKDTRSETRTLHYTSKYHTDGASILCAPLIYKNEVLGVISFGRKGVSSFSFSDIKMLTLAAGHVALAIANAKLYTKTKELSVKDELTQVYNRRHFQHMLQIEWKRAVRFYRELSIVMVDVDGFKPYNDTFGHLQGDLVLKEIGGILKSNLREVDTVARFGGEEFVLLLPDTDKHGAVAVAEKIRALIERHRFTTADWEPTRQVTISSGISTYPDDVADMDDLIDHADIALYKAKAEGRNRVVCFSPPSKPKKQVTQIVQIPDAIDKRTSSGSVEKGQDDLVPPTKTLQ